MPIRRFSGRQGETGAGNGFAAEGDFAFVHRFETGDGAQGGGLAAAGRAEQAADVTGVEVQIEVLHHALVLIAASEVAQVQQ